MPDSRNSGAAAAGRGHPEAIVRPKSAQQAFTVERVPVDAELAEFVDYYWYVGWDVPTPYRQQVVPQPRVHMAAEHHELVDERAEEAGPRLLAHGINREYFYRTLTGVGHTLGAAFHPGGFRPFLGASVGSISGTVRPAVRILGVDDRPAAARILSATEISEMAAAFDAYLLSIGPRPDVTGREVTALVAEAEQNVGIVRAEALAEHAGVSLRTLQRLFTEYVGVGPKWVIQRFRLLDAAAAAHSGTDVDWAGLAVDLGFSDQAHLTRAFARVVGTPPATYVREQRD